MPDPKLEQLRAEIQELSRKYDTAIMAVAANPGTAIYSANLEASWNCITIDDGMIQFYSKRFPQDQRKKVVEDTISLVMGMHAACEAMLHQLENARNCLAARFEISSIIRDEKIQQRRRG